MAELIAFIHIENRKPKIGNRQPRILSIADVRFKKVIG